MASPVVEIRFNDAEFGRVILKTTERNVQLAIREVTHRIEKKAIQKAPKVTDNLANGIFSYFQGKGFETEGTVKAPARYALFVHEGTGIFGPKGQPIFPKNKPLLKFQIGGRWYSAKSVKGQRPQPFLKEAFDEEGPKLRQLIFR